MGRRERACGGEGDSGVDEQKREMACQICFVHMPTREAPVVLMQLLCCAAWQICHGVDHAHEIKAARRHSSIAGPYAASR